MTTDTKPHGQEYGMGSHLPDAIPEFPSSESFDSQPVVDSLPASSVDADPRATPSSVGTSSAADPNASADFTYLKDYKGSTKADIVVNLFLNKRCTRNNVVQNLDGLERYFKDEIEEVNAFLCKTFKIKLPSWSALRSSTLGFVEEQKFDPDEKFTIAGILQILADATEHDIKSKSPPKKPKKKK